MEESCPFSKIGGYSTIVDFVDKFYYKVLFDKHLRNMFTNKDMNRVRSK